MISGNQPPYTGFRNMETVCFSRKRGKNGGPWALRLAAKASFAIQDWVEAWKKGF